MIRTLGTGARILTGLLATVAVVWPQAYTISAKPGAVSYIEGNVSINGAPVSASALRAMFLGNNDSLSTGAGKAEVLLSPGVFLRVGDDTVVRMVAASLVEMQVEIVSGEAMIEVDQVVPGSMTDVLDHNSSTVLSKPGLYRFTADGQPTMAVLEGKAQVYFGARKTDVGKGKQVLLTDELAVSKLDLDKADELYAWSNVRAQYDAAVSYQGSKSVYDAGGYGYASGYQTAGLYWNNPYNSWMWMPGNGAFYSPFGWGFYGPGVVAYAPVVSYGYGYGPYAYVPTSGTGRWPARPIKPVVPPATVASGGALRPLVVPVNPNRPGVAGFAAGSPAAYSAVRSQMVRSMANSGTEFHTANGTPAANLSAGRTYSNARAASHAAASSASSGGGRAESSERASGGRSWAGGGGVAGGSAGSGSPRASSIGSSAGSSGGGRSGGGSSGSGARSK